MIDIEELTDRQVEMICFAANGYTAKEISGIAYLSHHTVRNYIKAAKKKTGAKSLTQLVAWCVAFEFLKLGYDGVFTRIIEDE